MPNDLLAALARKIQTVINESGHYMVTLPAELEVLHKLGEPGIHDFARNHGWTTVCHLDHRPIEFFKIVPR
jgi:hypothetical protein